VREIEGYPLRWRPPRADLVLLSGIPPCGTDCESVTKKVRLPFAPALLYELARRESPASRSSTTLPCSGTDKPIKPPAWRPLPKQLVG